MTVPDCHPERSHKGRGLCKPCYDRAYWRRQLADYPKRLRTRDEFLDEYVVLRGEGHTHRQIADRLGMSLSAVRRAVCRGRAVGDARASVWKGAPTWTAGEVAEYDAHLKQHGKRESQ